MSVTHTRVDIVMGNQLAMQVRDGSRLTQKIPDVATHAIETEVRAQIEVEERCSLAKGTRHHVLLCSNDCAIGY